MRRKPRKDTTFYGRVLAARETRALDQARLLEGVDDLLAMTQVTLRDALRRAPRDHRLIFRGAESAAKLLDVRHRLAGGDKTDRLLRALEHARTTFDACPEEARREPNKDPPT